MVEAVRVVSAVNCVGHISGFHTFSFFPTSEASSHVHGLDSSCCMAQSQQSSEGKAENYMASCLPCDTRMSFTARVLTILSEPLLQPCRGKAMPILEADDEVAEGHAHMGTSRDGFGSACR